MNNKIREGKLTNECLSKILLESLKFRRDDIIHRSGVGEDVASISVGEFEVVLSTDPITATVSEIGTLVAAVNLNDIYTSTASPVALLLTILAPVGTTEEEIQNVMKDVASYSEKYGVEVIGGHTEITDAVNRMVLSATAIGIAKKGEVKTSRYITTGDKLYVTKEVGIEGTLIMLSELDKEEACKILDISAEEYNSLIYRLKSDISLAPEHELSKRVELSALHDVTEGGVLGAIHEMMSASKLGININSSNIKVSEYTNRLSGHFSVNPLRIFGSGSMLIAVSPSNEEKFIHVAKKLNLEISYLGEALPESHGIKLDSEIMSPPYTDELYDKVKE